MLLLWQCAVPADPAGARRRRQRPGLARLCYNSSRQTENPSSATKQGDGLLHISIVRIARYYCPIPDRRCQAVRDRAAITCGNGRVIDLAWAKPGWHLSQKGQLNPLYL